MSLGRHQLVSEGEDLFLVGGKIRVQGGPQRVRVLGVWNYLLQTVQRLHGFLRVLVEDQRAVLRPLNSFLVGVHAQNYRLILDGAQAPHERQLSHYAAPNGKIKEG